MSSIFPEPIAAITLNMKHVMILAIVDTNENGQETLLCVEEDGSLNRFRYSELIAETIYENGQWTDRPR